MRLLLTNYRYFPGGGSERYLFSVEAELRRRGHEVVPFSVRNSRNRPTPFADGFAEAPVHKDAWYFREHRLTPAATFRLARRAVYDPGVRRRARDAIRRHRLELSYVLNYETKLSPAVFDGARDAGVPVVLRLSDFHLSCAALMHYREGRPCDECLGRLPWPAVVHRCVKGSLGASLVRAGAMAAHRWMRILDRVDAFVTPSRFMLERLALGGIDRTRLHHIPTFVAAPPDPPPPPESGTVLYVGRIAPEKGPAVLLDAWARLARPGRRLEVVGPDNDGELGRLRRGLPGVRFHGPLEGEALDERYRAADLVVVPSLCHENLPHVVLEAMAWGRPVVASRVGSLPEALDDGVEGRLFPPGDTEALARAIDGLLDDPSACRAAGEAGRRRVLERHSPRAHLERLEGLFERLLSGRG